MDFIGVCGFAAVSSGALLILSSKEKELSKIISAVIYISVFVFIISKVSEYWGEMGDFLALGSTYLPIETVLKAGGMALLGTVCATVCEDIGQKGTSKALETFTVIEILYVLCYIKTEQMFEKIEGVVIFIYYLIVANSP